MKTVLVGGCFDILHFGHISFLTKAKTLGDTLIVALESDENVRRVKGPLRPIHSQENRKMMLEALSCVNEVISLPAMLGDRDYFDFVTRMKPSVIAVTEGDPITDKKKMQAETIGAELVIIPKIHTPSTSQLAKLLGLE
jgi:rfaE bifunctional protein nucleotidyltransferase chain/domain